MDSELEVGMTGALSTPEERKRVYLKGMENTEKGLRIAAQAFIAMEQAGDDISDIREGLRRLLRRIAKGTLLPECCTQLKGLLLNRVMGMPIEVQQHIIDGKPLPMLLIKDDGTGTDVLQVQPHALEPIQIRQIFGREGIRTEEEQRSWLEARKASVVAPPAIVDPIKVNKKRGGIEVNSAVFIAKKDLLCYVMELD